MTTSDDPPPGEATDGDDARPPSDDGRAPRRRAWPWVVATLALVAVLVGVGAGVFALLDRTFGADESAGGGSVVVEEGLSEGDAYGDNPDLDALWDACEDGDGTACDDLYLQSALGSGYEGFGYTCGERLGEAEERPLSCEEVTSG
ncbi:hypothetical protein [uncultured Pseudokineococcus sp.]|uniref:hypothetical protein n=1 Tax=uncultured Pseudokineococcus sp. TaxID=1642928 RepID=UPI0026090AAA|nr:hypothetical protein [uncultured Pseudokineococcus sp.]